MAYTDQFSYLRYQAYFSMKELIPILEKEISEKLNLDYVIRPWICDFHNMSEAKMYYIAIPKDVDCGIQVSFTQNNQIYIYETIDKNHDHFHVGEYQDLVHIEHRVEHRAEYLRKLLNNGIAFILTEKNIKKSDIFLTLVSDDKKDYYLFNNFFVYPEKLFFLNDTIEKFAKQKVKTPTN